MVTDGYVEKFEYIYLVYGSGSFQCQGCDIAECVRGFRYNSIYFKIDLLTLGGQLKMHDVLHEIDAEGSIIPSRSCRSR